MKQQQLQQSPCKICRFKSISKMNETCSSCEEPAEYSARIDRSGPTVNVATESSEKELLTDAANKILNGMAREFVDNKKLPANKVIIKPAPIKTKTCTSKKETVCGKELPADKKHFGIDVRAKDGITSICRECLAGIRKRRRLADKAHQVVMNEKERKLKEAKEKEIVDRKKEEPKMKTIEITIPEDLYNKLNRLAVAQIRPLENLIHYYLKIQADAKEVDLGIC